jgi:ubiquitin-large subunit ribosomal protein L40e
MASAIVIPSISSLFEPSYDHEIYLIEKKHIEKEIPIILINPKFEIKVEINVKLFESINGSGIMEYITKYLIEKCGLESISTIYSKSDISLYGELITHDYIDFSKCEPQIVEFGVSEKEINVNVKALTEKNLTINIDENAKIENLKKCVQDKEGIPIDQIRLVFAGRQLEDYKSLKYYGIVGGSTVHIVLRLRGGMLSVVSGECDVKISLFLSNINKLITIYTLPTFSIHDVIKKYVNNLITVTSRTIVSSGGYKFNLDDKLLNILKFHSKKIKYYSGMPLLTIIMP